MNSSTKHANGDGGFVPGGGSGQVDDGDAIIAAAPVWLRRSVTAIVAVVLLAGALVVLPKSKLPVLSMFGSQLDSYCSYLNEEGANNPDSMVELSQQTGNINASLIEAYTAQGFSLYRAIPQEYLVFDCDYMFASKGPVESFWLTGSEDDRSQILATAYEVLVGEYEMQAEPVDKNTPPVQKQVFHSADRLLTFTVMAEHNLVRIAPSVLRGYVGRQTTAEQDWQRLHDTDQRWMDSTGISAVLEQQPTQ